MTNTKTKQTKKHLKNQLAISVPIPDSLKLVHFTETIEVPQEKVYACNLHVYSHIRLWDPSHVRTTELSSPLPIHYGERICAMRTSTDTTVINEIRSSEI